MNGEETQKSVDLFLHSQALGSTDDWQPGPEPDISLKEPVTFIVFQNADKKNVICGETQPFPKEENKKADQPEGIFEGVLRFVWEIWDLFGIKRGIWEEIVVILVTQPI